MHIHIVTLFPKAFRSYLGESILKRAQDDGIIEVSFYNPRDFTDDSWRRVDQRPYGGGPGMVLQAEPILRAVQKAVGRKKRATVRVIFFSPSGVQFTTDIAKDVARTTKHLVLICGRYEGIDARVVAILGAQEVSVGPYVLTGGELPAMVVIDCIARQVPGVLGNIASLEESRVASSRVYTRPEVIRWKGNTYRVPDVLRSGDHRKIDEWKKGIGGKESTHPKRR